MKKYFNKTTYSILILVGFLSGAYWVTSAAVPLNRAPFCTNGTDCETSGTITRGQYKQGPLTIGSATTNASALYVDKPTGGLKVTGLVNCAAAPFTGAGAIPCPYPPYTPGTPTSATTRILGSGSNIGGYINTLVVGAPLDTPPTAQTSLDVHGQITADPAAGYLNYATGVFYPGSATDKPLCALPNGDIVVCDTVVNGSCGNLNGSTLTPPLDFTNPTPYCASGTPSTSGLTVAVGSVGWNCVGSGGGSTSTCSATNANGGVNTGGVVPANTGGNTGGVTPAVNNGNTGGVIPANNGGANPGATVQQGG